jgi:shikimate kinase
MNIILIGMRGSGKTEIGKFITEKIKFGFIETDKLIESNCKMPIQEIVAKFGWDYFREKEKQAINAIGNVNHKVISTGGGAILNRDNMAVLKQLGKVIWLKASIKNLVSRINKDSNYRPKLTCAKSLTEELKEIYKERILLYENNADFIIDTDGKNTDIISEEILMKLNFCKMSNLE